MTLKPPPSHLQPPKPRRLTACHRHPDEPSTSLCASCLRERLSLLNPSSCNLSSSSSNKISNLPTTISAAAEDEATCSSSHSAALPELRRCKTFSGNKCEVIGSTYEPRRRSCEVRDRNTLSNLFELDDGSGVKCQVESKNLGIFKGMCPVPPVLKEEDDEISTDKDEIDDEVRVSDGTIERNANVDNNKLNIEEDCEDAKTMKEYIDLEFRTDNKPAKKDLKEIAGSFWIAASVFSKKLHKWKRKQKTRRNDDDHAEDVGNGGGGGDGVGGTGLSLGEMRIENLRGRRLRDTQSEVGEYGFGRRSCDADPRCSLDLGRASIDCGQISVDGFGRKSCDIDPRSSIDLGRASVDGCCRVSNIDEALRRSSFEPPRASWDGYLIGRTMRTPPPPPMVSVIENAMATVYGFDDRRALIKEKVSVAGEDERKFVGSKYLTAALTSQRRKKEFDNPANSDRSANSKGVQLREDEAKSVSNARVSPATIDIFHGTKLVITEKELMGSRFGSLRDDSSESFESASKDMSSSSFSSNSIGGNRVNGVRKCRQWSKIWSVWGGLLSRRKHGKSGNEEVDTGSTANSSEKTEGNGEVTSGYSMKLVRSSSVATSRSSNMTMMAAASERGMKGRNETKYGLTKKRQDLVLKRNQSARHSPSSSLDNSMLRLYLTPLRSYRKSKLGKSSIKKSHSLARSVLGMY